MNPPTPNHTSPLPAPRLPLYPPPRPPPQQEIEEQAEDYEQEDEDDPEGVHVKKERVEEEAGEFHALDFWEDSGAKVESFKRFCGACGVRL